MCPPRKPPSIPEFFAGKSVFITGGTGFMGQVLIEKLLWSCPDLDKIYLLMRPKKGKEGNTRLVEMFKSPLYDRLKESKPDLFMEKVKFVSGDVTQPGLGLSPEDRKLMVDNVNIVFHSAASVRFDDPLKDAILMNTRGCREVMMLCREMKNLNVMLHVSTAYCNIDQNPVNEILYPPHADWRTSIEIAENVDNNTINYLAEKYMDGFPNSYTFTKNLAEHVVNDLKEDMNCVIIRPSIVISSLNEPMSGWIENFNGPVGLLIASGKGIMRSIYSNSDIRSDYIPVDIAIKAIIVAAWKHGTNKENTPEVVPIYNCSSSNLKDVTLQEIIDMGTEILHEIPLNDIMWAPGGGITNSRTIHFIKVLFLHLFPAFIIDCILRICGRKPMLFKLQRRIYIANIALQYFIMNQWTFNNEKLISLRNEIIEEDRGGFMFEFEYDDVYKFFINCILGARRYLLREPDDTLEKAKLHYRRLYYVDKVVQILFWCSMFYLLVNSVFFGKVFDTILSIFPV